MLPVSCFARSEPPLLAVSHARASSSSIMEAIRRRGASLWQPSDGPSASPLGMIVPSACSVRGLLAPLIRHEDMIPGVGHVGDSVPTRPFFRFSERHILIVVVS